MGGDLRWFHQSPWAVEKISLYFRRQFGIPASPVDLVQVGWDNSKLFEDFRTVGEGGGDKTEGVG